MLNTCDVLGQSQKKSGSYSLHILVTLFVYKLKAARVILIHSPSNLVCRGKTIASSPVNVDVSISGIKLDFSSHHNTITQNVRIILQRQ